MGNRVEPDRAAKRKERQGTGGQIDGAWQNRRDDRALVTSQKDKIGQNMLRRRALVGSSIEP